MFQKHSLGLSVNLRAADICAHLKRKNQTIEIFFHFPLGHFIHTPAEVCLEGGEQDCKKG